MAVAGQIRHELPLCERGSVLSRPAPTWLHARANGMHAPDRVALGSLRPSWPPAVSGERVPPGALCGEANGVECRLETERQIAQVRVMPHRLHMRRACGLGSNSSVLGSREMFETCRHASEFAQGPAERCWTALAVGGADRGRKERRFAASPQALEGWLRRGVGTHCALARGRTGTQTRARSLHRRLTGNRRFVTVARTQHACVLGGVGGVGVVQGAVGLREQAGNADMSGEKSLPMPTVDDDR